MVPSSAYQPSQEVSPQESRVQEPDKQAAHMLHQRSNFENKFQLSPISSVHTTIEIWNTICKITPNKESRSKLCKQATCL